MSLSKNVYVAVIAVGLGVAMVSGNVWSADKAEPPEKQRVYFGTYTRGTSSKGIYVANLERSSGKLVDVQVAAEFDNPSFVAIHPSGKFLIAVSEVTELGGAKTGAVGAFRIDPTGKLTLLNHQPTKGGAPCHVVVDRSGKYVLTANYVGGSICVHPIDGDGRLGEASSFVQHQGKGANAKRQEAPHAHSINVDPANRFAYVADLGLDQVLCYHFDAERGTLAANPSSSVRLKAGAGPRHFAFHPSGKFAFTNNEMHSTVTALQCNPESGKLIEINTLSTLPAGPVEGNSTAECQVHPKGKFVYVSNRGHNSIAIFAVDQASGKISHVGNESTRGKTPRNFCIDPTGTFLLAENQGSDNVVVFRIDPSTGKLAATGSVADVPAPVCAKFWPAPK